ncbi:hypothetical protein [uncultured Amphritea sp.]|uniref:hypothetical protein n=1 Tax=uncultured Amphritea sp. TaxID=981605 RepID=UPI00262317BF|nr:hypothetical protein [uncultured Amphritea sp.]
MALLTRDQILAADDHKTEVVPVPEWGGEVMVGTMSGTARDKLEASVIGKNGGANLTNARAKYLAACVVDEAGNLMFSEKDITKLGSKSVAALDRVFEVAQRLNRITDADLEDLAKN